MHKTVFLKATGMAGLMLLLLAPGAAAHPVDIIQFGPAPVPPPPLPFLPVNSPPYDHLDPATVTAVTHLALAQGIPTGVAACNIAGEACFAFPTWNPFWSPGPGGPIVGAIPTFWWCQVTFHTPQWVLPGAPPIQIHVVFDGNNDNILTNVFPDRVFSSIGVIGPLPFDAIISPRAGAWVGGPFAPIGGPYTPANIPIGSIVHIIASEPGGGVLQLERDTAVSCWVY